MSEVVLRLISILGKRAMVAFGIVTFLVAGLLASVNIASRHALKKYVEDQLGRIPWDFTVYETEQFGYSADISKLPLKMREVDGIDRVERLAFLRARLPVEGVYADIDGKTMGTPWLSLLAATNPVLLPPQYTLALGENAGTSNEAVLALVGPERAMGPAFLSLQGAKQFSLKIANPERTQERVAFSMPIRSVIRLEREELNQFLMNTTGSISYVPAIGAILMMPFDAKALSHFESVSLGLVPEALVDPGSDDPLHIERAEYMPEVLYLGQMTRNRFISGWDIGASVTRVTALRDQVDKERQAVDSRAVVDSTTLVLLERMAGIARIIGIISFLIALPLLWMAWVLAANLSGLLMLNERRKLGLMRLRGVPGDLLGRAFLLSIAIGGFIGGVLGLIVGTVLPILAYEGGGLPADAVAQRGQVIASVVFLAITLGLAFLVSRRLVRYATTISPLEASGRVAASEVASAKLQVGALQWISLLLGTYTIVRWISEFSINDIIPLALFRLADSALDFIGLPLFLYGIVTVLVSRSDLIHAVLKPAAGPLGGRLGPLALKHIAMKPHRTGAFLLIVGLMASVSLYPTVASPSFEDKAIRGARVQLGSELQLTFNSPDLATLGKPEDGLGPQFAALDSPLKSVTSKLRQVNGVQSVTSLFEVLLPDFFLPGYGLVGVPMYILADSKSYLRDVYAEPELGITERFESIIAALMDRGVAVSPLVADFWSVQPGSPVPFGKDIQHAEVSAPSKGVLAFLPGRPPKSITDRRSYVQARLDYLNHLFGNDAYVVAANDSNSLTNLHGLIPRVIMLVKLNGDVPVEDVRRDALAAIDIVPLAVHSLPDEIAKISSDMFIALALENMNIYLIGGLLLALIAILAVALTNYTEDRRTLVLLRIRGTSPAMIRRFIAATLLAPAMLGLVLGVAIALVAGFGLANHVWQLRELRTIVQMLPTRLVASTGTISVALLLVGLVISVAWFSSSWVFRRTAREDLQEG